MMYQLLTDELGLSLPVSVLDGGFANEVPIMISDEPEVNRIFRPGIFYNIQK
jgi:hypothetical protein